MTTKAGWAGLVLGAFQPLQADEVRRLLDEQRRLDAERLGLPRDLIERRRRMAPEDMAENDLREVAARLRTAVEAFDVTGGPLAACHSLRRLKGALARIDATSLLSTEDRNYHARTLQEWQSRWTEAVGPWDDEARSAVVELLNAADDAVAAADRIVAMTGSRSEGRRRPAAGSCWAEVKKLGEAVRRAQSLAGAVPGAEPQRLPMWPALDRAVAGIIRPFRANLFLCECAVLLARADGDLSALERDCLFAMADAVHLTPVEAKDLVEGGVSSAARPAGPADAATALQEMCRRAVAEGVPRDAVRRGLLIGAGHLGIPEAEMEGILSATCGGAPSARDGDRGAPVEAPAQDLCFLDMETAIGVLKSQAELPPMTWLGTDAPPELLGRVRKALRLDEAEEPLLVYEFRYLGATGECGALNRLRLLWKPSPAEAVPIGVESVARWQRDIFQHFSPLQAGRQVRTSTSATAFLTLVLACVKRSLVRVRAV
jgi:hypothetical protein